MERIGEVAHTHDLGSCKLLSYFHLKISFGCNKCVIVLFIKFSLMLCYVCFNLLHKVKLYLF
jgi:hypothetical protein